MRIFARNFGTNYRSKRIFARNFGTNCHSKRIFARKFASTTTIGIAKIRRIFCELSLWTKIRHFSSKSPEIRAFRRITFSLLFHNTVVGLCLHVTTLIHKLGQEKGENLFFSQTNSLKKNVTRHLNVNKRNNSYS